MNDSQIIELYFQRSETAITETSKKYEKYCKSIIYNITRNNEDTKECLNDTYMSLWESIPPNKPTSFSSYIGRIARNIAINFSLKKKTKKRNNGQLDFILSELEECIPNKTLEDVYDEKILLSCINEFLESLPPLNRKVFVRRYWLANSIKEISKQYDMNENNVKSLLFRMRASLKEYLEKEGYKL